MVAEDLVQQQALDIEWTRKKTENKCSKDFWLVNGTVRKDKIWLQRGKCSNELATVNGTVRQNLAVEEQMQK